MTQICSSSGAQARIQAMAFLIAKTVAQQKKLLVFAPEESLAESLDRQLWSSPPTSFIPHVREDSPLADKTPVVITNSLENMTHDERLFNLSNEIPVSFARFQSVIEVVGKEAEEREKGRERVKFYKERGYTIRFFNLGEP